MTDEQIKRRNKSGSFWRELPVLLAVALVVAFLVRQFVVQTFFIPSESMEHTLDRNDHVLVNKLVYDFRTPAAGEIIVFEAPESWRDVQEHEDFIKRVIGAPGDRVVCCDPQGRIAVNGHPLDEPYVYPGNKMAPSAFDITVPEGRLWVMGDHREASADSLANYNSHGHDLQQATIPVDAVIGRAFVLFWPFDRSTWLTTPETFDGVRQ
ncbi:signal peptidase I [Catellatospora tritici]|uniref:signal peptidase I n=1 Tax=Catellatospora tritici TaxID=2851566 RepID=UPI001C2D6087|nr:signal peptidase I [Catellatospora tritici]MBV1853543.1 signal peptidase I [Catellatospora tritici]